MLQLDAENLRIFLDRIAATRPLVAPTEQDGQAVFARVTGAAAVSLDGPNPVRSAKDWLYPQSERLFRFHTGRGALSFEELEFQDQPVLFGIRPCDLAALNMLDEVLLAGEFADAHYRARRKKTTLVGLACARPGATCCCTAFGLTPGTAGVSDVILYPAPTAAGPAGGRFYAEALTPAGEALLAMAPDLFSAAADGEGEAAREYYLELPVPLGTRVRTDGISRALDGMFDSPIWGEISRTCLSCGACTYLCPTCYCFALADAARGERGARIRCWDSCQYPNFTLMAGGHNPRPTKLERTRQRFMHKLNYHEHRYGRLLCVGCGRCIEHCPAGIHVAGVIAAVEGGEGVDR